MVELANPSSELRAEQARAGDIAAFASMVAAYHAALLRVAYVVTGDVEPARELLRWGEGAEASIVGTVEWMPG